MHPRSLRLRCAAAGALAIMFIYSLTPANASAQQNAAQQNGAQQNGARQNGAQQNGARQNGAQQNGARQNGAQQNAAQRNAAPKSGIRQNDARQTSGTIDSLARAFQAQYSTPALVIGVVNPKGERILPYGADEGTTPVSGDTRFEVGSVTKIFTSLLLADMVESGEVKLDDPISRYLPDSVSMPEYRGQPITLRELATHTSSLPRLPTNIAPANMADPYADYDSEKLYAFLDSYDLSQAPDTHYEYSNLGAGLLGFLLASQADTSYAEILQQRVIQPLGLEDTYVAELGGDMDERLARGHAAGKPVAYWHFGVLEGAGAVRSTANDLLRLLSAELHPAKAPLSRAVELSQKIRYRVSPQLALALGWHVVPLPDSSSLYWHNGGTGGARSFVGFAPGTGVGIVVLTNVALPLDVVNQFAFQVARAALRL